MNKNDIITMAEKFINDSPGNYIAKEIALYPSCVGMKIFEAPIFAFGAADDDIYMKYKASDVIGSHFLSPTEWLPSAKTVLSFFLPYTEKSIPLMQQTAAGLQTNGCMADMRGSNY